VWAVVGLSSNADRPAFAVARTLLHHGRIVIPVNPRKEDAHGQTAYASLLDIPESQRVDVVDLFVASERAGAVVDDAIKRGARAVWFQLGVCDSQVLQPPPPPNATAAFACKAVSYAFYGITVLFFIFIAGSAALSRGRAARR
jgi:predicted CoA-binding protein